jgi:Flp pilus assembly protein TadG
MRADVRGRRVLLAGSERLAKKKSDLRLGTSPSFLKARSGAAAVIFALGLVPLMAFLGAALDYTAATMFKTRLQHAVDEAALVAAQNPSLTQPARQQLAISSILANLGNSASGLNVTTAESEPSSGRYQVNSTLVVPTTIMKMMKINSITVSATATALAGPTNSNSVCILALSQTASPGMLANSSVVINAPTCEIDVASTGNPAATFNGGDSFSVSKLCVAGTQILNNAGTISPLKTGCPVAADPFAGKLPTVTVGGCDVNSQNYSGNITLNPGVYCGGFNFNGSGTVTFNPGLYVFKGVSWNMNSGWTMNGYGVTFYFADSSYMQINGGVTANLTAPISGTYANILMYEPSGLPQSGFTINGQAGHNFQGLIYLPSRNITFNSMSNVTSEAMTIVVNSVILDTLNWNLKSSAYVIPGSGASGGGAVRLIN